MEGEVGESVWEGDREVVYPIAGDTISCDILRFEDFTEYVCLWT
jgi:hypothetical protein